MVGYATSPLGLGEDLRQAAYALLANGVSINIVDLKTASQGFGYESLAPHISDKVIHPVSIFFVSPFAYANLLKRSGAAFAQTYKIGNFVWELEDFPQSWNWVLGQVNEIWVPTMFVSQMFKKTGARNCLINPTPATPPTPTRGSFRDRFGYDDDVFVYGFMFDLHSTPQRKNPMALLRAYEKVKLLVAGRVKTALLIKVHRADRPSSALVELKTAADQIPGVQIFVDTLPADQVGDFYNTIDAYVSLHRSEGLGRTIIEAVQLGIPTICTAYSGERDVLERCDAQRVQSSLIPCRPQDYPNCEGSVWADPSLEHAAVLMARAARAGRVLMATPTKLNAHFSADAYATRTIQRLRAIVAKA